LNQLAKIETGNLIQEYGLEGLPLMSGILQESISSGVIVRHGVPWQSRWGCGEGFVSPHPPDRDCFVAAAPRKDNGDYTEIASSLPLLTTTAGIIPGLPRFARNGREKFIFTDYGDGI